MSTEIYLDNNATTAVLPAAVQAAVDAMQDTYGNPSSTHAAGLRARRLMDDVRARAGRILGAGDGRIMFNSGATEGIQTAVLSALCAIRQRRDRGLATGSLLLYGATEHKAVSESLAHWNAVLGLGLTLQKLPVGPDGRHNLDVLRALAPDAAFVCTMAANNETGAISDLDGLAAALEGSTALWMVDCVQALGKLPLQLAATRIDYAPFSGHKLYAPKGVGMLYVRAGAPFTPLMIGGGQECGARSGTENMAGIAALGAVLAALERGGIFRTDCELQAMRTRVAASLRAAFPALVFNTPLDHALPTTLNFSVPEMNGRDLLNLFDAAGVQVSAGSACSAAKAQASYVLEAMGLAPWRAANAVRLSFGPAVDDATIAEACARIRQCGQAAGAGGLPDGVVQFSADGRHTWLVLDAQSRTAAVIDLQPDVEAEVRRLLGLHRYRLLAQLFTSGDRPAERHADDLALGERRLRRVAIGATQQAFLLRLEDGPVRFAFTGKANPRLVQDQLGPATVCCPSDDRDEDAGDALERGMHLDAAALAALLRAHPDALVVDVREAHEHAASRFGPDGYAAVNVPLSRLVNQVPQWLSRQERVPLVFFCRSGNRSRRAALCLRRSGYDSAFHLAGGVALSGAALRLRHFCIDGERTTVRTK